ncbi:MAG: caspase family protein [Sphingomonadaceae bacterium]|nr:caspase family protein [Sphingomonadaceae bacterium]
MTRLLAPLVLLFTLLLPLGAAHAETRALIIGSDYSSTPDAKLRLANPVADARMVRAALARTSVRDVTLLEDPDAEQWAAGFQQFADSLSGDDIALLYYAGHGFQIDGSNYLLSGDGVSLISLDSLLRTLTERARGVVVVVDACRNNPFFEAEEDAQMRVVAVEGDTRSLQSVTLDDLAYARNGLAQLANLRGLSAVVFFSTEPGNVAEDGDTPGKGSPFAKVFTREIKRRQSLDETFRKTAVGVNSATDGRQSPWRQGDLPFNVFIAGMRALPIP